MIRVVKTKEKTAQQMLLIRLGAFLLALAAGGLFILMLGFHPIDVYKTIISGAFAPRWRYSPQ